MRRNAVFVVFGLAGFDLASWLSRIPTARSDLDATTFQMGLLALGISLGSIAGFTVAGHLHGLPASRAIGIALSIAAAGLLTAATSVEILGSLAIAFLGLLLLGFGAGVCNVVMNVEAAAVSRHLGVDIMPRFHALFSIGGVVGAGCGTLATALGVGVLPHLVATAIVVVGGGWFAVRFLCADDALVAQTAATTSNSVRSPRTRSAWLERRTLLVGLLVLGMSFASGSANDWIALSMVADHNLSATLGSMTYGVFMVCATSARFAGPLLLARLGRARVVQFSALCATLGIVVFVFVPNPVVAIVAVGLWGAGAALGFPIGMSAAADDPARAAARIGVVATIGYGASISGPPVIGFLGEQFGLSHALLLVVVLVVAAGLVAPVLRTPGGEPTDHRRERSGEICG